MMVRGLTHRKVKDRTFVLEMKGGSGWEMRERAVDNLIFDGRKAR